MLKITPIHTKVPILGMGGIQSHVYNQASGLPIKSEWASLDNLSNVTISF